MSIFIDESSKSWTDFKRAEKLKFPHFEKDWFDTDGVISGNKRLSSWKWETRQYAKDRRQFLNSEQLPRPENQIPKPLIQKAKTTSPVKENIHQSGQRQAPVSTAPTNSFQRRPQSSKMPRPTKRSQAWRRRGRPRRKQSNKALSSVKVPFKIVIEIDSKKSSAETGHWHNHLTIAELAGGSLKLHEEFKCCSMKVRFIPRDVTTGAGLYAACLLDQNGFGDPAQATTTWFPRVSDLPGARLCHVTKGCIFNWHPTEPDSRNYRKADTEANYVVASFYMFGDAIDLSLKGQLLITGLLRARGEYYSANIASRIKALSLLNDPDNDDIQSLE